LVGERIRTQRRRRRVTLSRLAEATGLSPSAISQVERGLVDPSLRTLRAIAKALDVPVFSLLIEVPSPHILVRKNQRRSFSMPDRQAVFELLTPDLNRRLEMAMMHLEPGASSSEEPLPHAGDECLLVVEGAAQVEMPGARYVLSEGDSIYIDEGMPHRVTNVGEVMLVCVSGFTPPAF